MGSINLVLSANIDINELGKTSFWGTKTYLKYSPLEGYRAGELSVCKLNAIQRILRSVFGCYSDTHLKTVFFALHEHTATLSVERSRTPYYKRFFRWVAGSTPDASLLKIDELGKKIQSCWNKKYPKVTISLGSPTPAFCDLTVADCEKTRPFRASIFAQTMHAARTSFLVGKEMMTLDKNTQRRMQESTVVMRPGPLAIPPVYGSTKVEVVKEDCVEFGLKLKSKGYNPVILNMANEDTPGGGVKYGSSAQEESICIRSDYMLALDPENNPSLRKQMPFFKTYNIPEDGVIYTSSIQVFREDRDGGYRFKKPRTIDVIACAAYDVKSIGRPANYEEGMKAKIRATLRAAVIKGNDAIVLSALGCGAFANDAKEVANLFALVLKEKEFEGRFRKITFAIIDDRNGANHKPFYDRLHGMKI